MRIRWMIRKRIVTADKVKEYADKHQVSASTAKAELERDNTGQVLQYRTWYGRWRDVPYKMEYFQ